jgi:hypothetical protein
VADETPLEMIEIPASCTSLVDWVNKQEKVEGVCLPCGFSVIVPWYRNMLRDNGYKDLAKEVEQLGKQDDDARLAAQILDGVKQSVDNSIVESHLRMYDCYLQEDGGN